MIRGSLVRLERRILRRASAPSFSPVSPWRKPGELFEHTGETANLLFVLWRHAQKLRLEPVRITEKRKRLSVLEGELREELVVDDPSTASVLVVEGAKLIPQAVEAGTRARAHQPVHAVVDRVAVSLPGCAQTPGNRVFLEDLGVVAASGKERSRRQSGDAGPDDKHARFVHDRIVGRGEGGFKRFSRESPPLVVPAAGVL